MQITVFGASGRVGRLVVDQALERGYQVVAFVHSVGSLEAKPGLQVVQGDVHNAAAVVEAIKGSTAVISALGSWGTKSKDIVSAGIANIIPGMEANGMTRVISLTGSDARAKGDLLGLLHRLTHMLIRISPVRKILSDGERHIQLLEASKLDYTVVRSPAMNNRGDAAHFKLSDKRPAPWATINRQSVATAMLDLIKSSAHSRRAPQIIRH